VIATGGATVAALAKAATSSIPIVFAIGADPVKFSLVVSMNRPGGNVTGVSFLANTLVAKQLQLLQGYFDSLEEFEQHLRDRRAKAKPRGAPMREWAMEQKES